MPTKKFKEVSCIAKKNVQTISVLREKLDEADVAKETEVSSLNTTIDQLKHELFKAQEDNGSYLLTSLVVVEDENRFRSIVLIICKIIPLIFNL